MNPIISMMANGAKENYPGQELRQIKAEANALPAVISVLLTQRDARITGAESEKSTS